MQSEIAPYSQKMKSPFNNRAERDAAYLAAFQALAPALFLDEALDDLYPSHDYRGVCLYILMRYLGAHDSERGVLTVNEFEEVLDELRRPLVRRLRARGIWPSDPAIPMRWNEAVGAIDDAIRIAKSTPSFPR